MAANGVNKLYRKMNNLSLIIEKLFPTNSKPILKDKISQLEDMIPDLPDHLDILADEWRDKVVGMWERYCTTSPMPGAPSLGPNWRASSSTRLERPQNGLHNGINGHNDSSIGNGAHQYQLQVDPVDQLSKDAFLEHWVSQFAALDQLSDEPDLLGLKKLLVAVAVSLKKSFAFPGDNELKANIFCLAIAKLSESKQAEYRDFYGADNSNLKSLIQFLKKQIVNQLKAKHEAKAEAAINQNDSTISTLTESTGDGIRCQYCKEPGHMTYQCVEIKNQLCFSCFQFGHRNKQCDNLPMFKF